MEKLSARFNNEWPQKKALLKNELAVEKATLKRARKKMWCKMKRIWNFTKSQASGSSTTPPEFNPHEDADDDDAEDNGDDQYGTPNLGNGSQP